MAILRRIYFSMPADEWLDANQRDLQWGLVDKVEHLGYTVEVFARPRGKPSLAAGKAWSVDEVDKVARRCIGAVIVGMPRWVFETHEGEFRFGTEYCHYEGAVVETLGLPKLVVAEDDLIKRVIFDMKGKEYIATFPREADHSWLETDHFDGAFMAWKEELDQRRDVFLGYCGSSKGVAKNIKNHLTSLGATVLDWRTDFSPGGTILEQIQEAASRCSGGIFLFTKDDTLAEEGEEAAPRDNVVFEAGFFVNAKGKERVLIVREKGSKMPADLGGNIYATLEDRSDIGPIEDQLGKFLEERL